MKKSFTLVELSIVLLVLALLVSTLLVGRQIIDRAKVQQVISEIDYYTKNFQMFRDQYDFLPGALGVDTCRKYPEFSMQKGDDTTKYQSQCDDPISMLGGSAAKYYTSYKQANFSMVDMVASGMVENKSPGERRRKKFDIATVTVNETVEVPIVRGGRAILKSNFLVSDVDFQGTASSSNGMSQCFYRVSSVTFADQIRLFKLSEIRSTESSFSNKTIGQFINSLNSCSMIGNGARFDTTGLRDECGGRKCDCVCKQVDGTNYDMNYYAAYVYDVDKTSVKLSSSGLSRWDGKTERITGTITKEGEARFGYLLKQEEIENQANRSNFDNRVYVSYTGGKVNNLMIYGVGNDNVFSGAGENNIVVFFKFNQDKTELTDDGAVSFDLYDLLSKKIEQNFSLSNLDTNRDGFGVTKLIPVNKTTGDGFNFGYIMR